MNRKAAVITISDKGSRGERVDTSGPALCGMLLEGGYDIVHTAIVPDDYEKIRAELLFCADTEEIPLVLTTGGTGFSPRDITPEATKSVIERETPGIPEAMRAESMRITPRGCLSRSTAGIRRKTLIVNLPGSEKAARENLLAVLPALEHGIEMLLSAGSADCGTPKPAAAEKPSADVWLKEAKAGMNAGKIGMYLIHNGVVRETSRASVRDHAEQTKPVIGMKFSFDAGKLEEAINEARAMEGIVSVRVWLADGVLQVGDDIMMVLIGGDIRPHVTAALDFLVGKIKAECVKEEELYE